MLGEAAGAAYLLNTRSTITSRGAHSRRAMPVASTTMRSTCSTTKHQESAVGDIVPVQQLLLTHCILPAYGVPDTCISKAQLQVIQAAHAFACFIIRANLVGRQPHAWKHIYHTS